MGVVEVGVVDTRYGVQVRVFTLHTGAGWASTGGVFVQNKIHGALLHAVFRSAVQQSSIREVEKYALEPFLNALLVASWRLDGKLFSVALSKSS